MLIRLAQVNDHPVNLNSVENILCRCPPWKNQKEQYFVVQNSQVFPPSDVSRNLNCVVESFKFLRKPIS